MTQVPFPELVDPTSRWKLRTVENKGSTSMLEKKGDARYLSSPDTSSFQDEVIRAHELVHAAKSPKWRSTVRRAEKRASPFSINCVEEMRVGLLMKHKLGMDMSRVFRDVTKLSHISIENAEAHFDTKELVLLCSCVHVETGNYIEVVKILKKKFSSSGKRRLRGAMRVASIIREKLERSSMSFRDTVKIAQWLDDYLRLPKNCAIPRSCMCAGDQEPDEDEEEEGCQLPDSKRKELAGKLKDFNKPSGTQIPPTTEMHGNWGDMTIIEPKRTIRTSAKHLWETTYRPSDAGSVVSSPHRSILDGQVFGRLKRRKKARFAILLDHSGSMSNHRGWTKVLKLLEESPQTIVASYAGYDYGKGKLAILAKDGYRVDKPIPLGNGNIIDGPALIWLSQQEGVKIWVSDGGVTGKGDGGSPVDLQQECKKICREAKITQYGDPLVALEVIDEYMRHV